MSDGSRPRLILVAGPTASGKSALALRLAQGLGAEILVADSRQVYRGMDVGTAKATPAQQQLVPHHGLDLVNPVDGFDAAQFQSMATTVLADVHSRGRPVVVEGGSGLYLRALVRGLMAAPPRSEAVRQRLRQDAERDGWPALHQRLAGVDPVYASRIAATDPVRITRGLEVFELSGRSFSELGAEHAQQEGRFQVLGFLLDPPRELHAQRVQQRAVTMWSGGLLAETEALLRVLPPQHPLLCTIGYAQAARHLLHGLPEQDAREELVMRTLQYAKRQRTWFRKEPYLDNRVDDTADAQWLTRCQHFLEHGAVRSS